MTDPRRIGLLPAAGVQTPRPMFRTLGIAASGLSGQRARLETIAQNIANADVTRTAEGGPYRRRVAMLETAEGPNGLAASSHPAIAGTLANPVPPFGAKPFELPALGDSRRGIQIPLTAQDDGMHGVRVAGVAIDPTDEFRMAYEPGHPDADENGYVRYPNIEPTQEMVNLLDAKRLYEANASVFQTAKSMLRAALDI